MLRQYAYGERNHQGKCANCSQRNTQITGPVHGSPYLIRQSELILWTTIELIGNNTD